MTTSRQDSSSKVISVSDYKERQKTKQKSDEWIQVPNSKNLFIVGNSIVKTRDDGHITVVLSPLPEIERVDVCDDEVNGFKNVIHTKIGDDRAKLTIDDLTKSYGLWIDSFPSVDGLDNKWNREAYVSVIRHLAKSAPHFHYKKKSGVHKDNDGVHFFLSRHSYIYGNVEPKIQYHLLNESDERIDQFETLSSNAIKRLIKDEMAISPKGQLLIATVHYVSSLLNQIRPEIHRIGYALCFWGLPTSKKTSTASLARSQVYPYDYKSGLDCLFTSTLTSIELTLNRLADVPVLIDDFGKWSSDHEYKKKLAIFESIVFASYNKQAIRGRATRNLSEAESNLVRSLPIVTADHMPTSVETSFYRRILAIKFEIGDIISETNGEHKGIAEYGSKIEGKLKSFYAQIVRSVLDHLNLGSDKQIGQKLIECQQEYTVKIRHKVNEVFPDENKDYRENLCSIAGSLMATAKYIDDLFKTKTSIQDALFPLLVNAIHNQLTETLSKSSEDFDSEILMTELYEQLRQGIAHNGAFYGIEVYEGSEDLPATLSFVIGKTKDRKEVIDVGWLDLPKKKLILSNTLQIELARISKKKTERDWKVSEVFELFEQEKRIVSKPKKSDEKGSKHRISGTEKKPSGWHIDGEWAYQLWLESKDN